MNRDETVQQVVQEMLDKALANVHPDADELVAYHEGTLSPKDTQRVQDHLVACRECAALLADLEGLGDPDFGAEEEIPDDAGDIVWEKVREEIRKEAPAKALPPPIPFRRKETARMMSPRWFQALAASLLVATVGLSAWVASLRGRVEELQRPQLNAPVLDLYPADSTRGDGGPDVSAPADAPRILFVLHTVGRPAFDDYAVEILNADRQVVWKGGGLELDADGLFTLTLPREFLGLRLRLVGIDPGGGRQIVQEYELPVEGP